MVATVFSVAVYVHFLAGFSSLLSGFVAMISKKGSRVHTKTGLVFYWSMFLVFISTTLFFLLYPTNVKYQFFLGISIISFYPNWSGKRILAMKKEISATELDKTMAWLVGASGLMMVLHGAYLTINPNQNSTA